jgi:hypothetical protein
MKGQLSFERILLVSNQLPEIVSNCISNGEYIDGCIIITVAHFSIDLSAPGQRGSDNRMVL